MHLRGTRDAAPGYADFSRHLEGGELQSAIGKWSPAPRISIALHWRPQSCRARSCSNRTASDVELEDAVTTRRFQASTTSGCGRARRRIRPGALAPTGSQRILQAGAACASSGDSIKNRASRPAWLGKLSPEFASAGQHWPYRQRRERRQRPQEGLCEWTAIWTWRSTWALLQMAAKIGPTPP